ncbi:hypothetical protein MCAV_02890 [[Mycoplasma] cavipharyngis]|uniref:Mbov_0400 family ICE element protein n=1 Tax=[Mycoplasma] cavipharyngis TaxID=92757 RepID=UPI003703E104
MKNNDKLKPNRIKKENNNVTFTELQEPLDHCPLIVSSNNLTKEYYYLKIRPARDENNVLKIPIHREILIPKKPKVIKGLFFQDTYVNTNKIYHIKKSEINKYFDKNKIYKMKFFDRLCGILIYDTLLNNLEQELPFCSITKVSYNQDQQKFESINEYCHKILINYEYDKFIDSKKREQYKPIYQNIKINNSLNCNNLELCKDVYFTIQKERGNFFNKSHFTPKEDELIISNLEKHQVLWEKAKKIKKD